MWIENLLNQININNVNQLGGKKDEITQECFLNLLNTIILCKEVYINEGDKGIKDINVSYENKNDDKYLKDVDDILLNLINIIQSFQNSQSQVGLFENLDDNLIDTKILDGFSKLKKKEIPVLLERVFSEYPVIGRGITNILLSEKNVLNKDFSVVEPLKNDNQKLSFQQESSEVETKIYPEKLKDLLSKNPAKPIVNIDKKENPLREEINDIEQSVSNTFEKKVMDIKNLSEEAKYNITDNKINFHEKIVNENVIDLDNSHIAIKIQTTKNEKEFDNNNFDNNFHLVTGQNFKDMVKKESNNLEFIEKIVEVKKTDDIKKVFKEQILIKKENEHSITLIMEPKEIGKVKVTFTINDGVIKAEVFPNTEQARNFFRENMDKIIASLGSEGINLGQFTLKDDRESRNNEKNIEKSNRLQNVDSGFESKGEIKSNSNLNGLSIYA